MTKKNKNKEKQYTAFDIKAINNIKNTLDTKKPDEPAKNDMR